MIINKRTWHYRIWASTFSSSREVPAAAGLCQYFWTVVNEIGNRVASVVGMTVLFAVCLGILVAALGAAGLAVFKGVPAVVHVAQGQAEPVSDSEGLGFAFLVIGTAIGLIVVYARCVHRRIVSTLELGLSMLKAKADGICPTVSFKD